MTVEISIGKLRTSPFSAYWPPGRIIIVIKTCIFDSKRRSILFSWPSSKGVSLTRKRLCDDEINGICPFEMELEQVVHNEEDEEMSMISDKAIGILDTFLT